MKKSLAIGCLVSVFAASSFAQSAPNKTPAEVGAQLVAERDAAWQKAHSGGMMVKEPMAPHKAERAKHHTRAKHVKHAKHKIKKTG